MRGFPSFMENYANEGFFPILPMVLGPRSTNMVADWIASFKNSEMSEATWVTKMDCLDHIKFSL